MTVEQRNFALTLDAHLVAGGSCESCHSTGYYGLQEQALSTQLEDAATDPHPSWNNNCIGCHLQLPGAP